VSQGHFPPYLRCLQITRQTWLKPQVLTSGFCMPYLQCSQITRQTQLIPRTMTSGSCVIEFGSIFGSPAWFTTDTFGHLIQISYREPSRQAITTSEKMNLRLEAEAKSNFSDLGLNNIPALARFPLKSDPIGFGFAAHGLLSRTGHVALSAGFHRSPNTLPSAKP
jgi:hypothetical protein